MTKADQQAAERLLKAAVKRAIAQYREEGIHPARSVDHWCSTQKRVVAMLRAAGESAELLLGEAS